MESKERKAQFARVLGEIVSNKSLKFREIEVEVSMRYGRSLSVTAGDIWKYLSAERLPRADKLAAICDVCEATPEQLTELMRSFRKVTVATSD